MFIILSYAAVFLVGTLAGVAILAFLGTYLYIRGPKDETEIGRELSADVMSIGPRAVASQEYYWRNRGGYTPVSR